MIGAFSYPGNRLNLTPIAPGSTGQRLWEQALVSRLLALPPLLA